MDNVTPFDWQRLLLGEDPPLFYGEIVFRVVLVYLVGLLLMKLLGKRARRELTSFDMLIIIALGSAVGDALFYPEVPLLHAVAVLIVVVVLSRFSAHLSAWWRRFDKFIGDTPSLLIEDGEIDHGMMQKEALSKGELYSMLRENGITHTREVQRCYLELSGEISVIRSDDGSIEGQGVSVVPPLHKKDSDTEA